MTIHPPTHSPVHPGRRPSVERTTARRCPSTRKRPGAGFLPTWLPVARVAETLRGPAVELAVARIVERRARRAAVGLR